MSSNELTAISISEAEFTHLVPSPTPDPISAQSERDRFNQFVVSSVARHRLLYSRQLGVMASTDLDLVLHALLPLATDTDHQVRVSACTDLDDIYRAGVLQNLHVVVLDVIVQVLQIVLMDEAGDLRWTAMESVLNMVPIMSATRINELVIPIADRMWNSGSSDEIRASAVVLLYRLIPWLTADQIHRIRQQTAAWSKDHSFRVRKAVARYIFQVGGEFLPIAESLSRDPIWSVRQAIVQGLIQSVQRIESHDLRQEFLIPQLKRACADISIWVRKDSHEVLGAFLFYLGSDQIDDELLTLFTALPTLSQDAADNDAHFACAFHFPAVAARLGKTRWPDLLPSYLQLCRNPTFKVRRTLAYSLHEIGRIVGPEITDRDLVPVFEIFFKDLDEVRQGIIDHLCDMLSCMSVTSRLAYIDLLWDIQKETSRQWRVLMHDRVAHVRKIVVQSMGSLLRLVQRQAPDAFDELVVECLNLATAESCHDRQLFLLLCQFLLYTIHVPLFRRYFLSAFVALAHDRVINVRRLLVRVIFELPVDHAIRSDPDVVLAMRYLHSAEQGPSLPSMQSPLPRASLDPAKSTSEEVDLNPRSDDVKGSGEFVQDSGPFAVSV